MTIRLNSDQERAAKTLDRSVVVTAGAGSGKTRLLTQRFLNAILPGEVDAWEPATVDEILAITFTDKAAGELAERVRGALRSAQLVDEARRVDNAWVSTIHGLCSRLLRRHALEAGIDPLFSVADAVVTGNLRAAAFESAATGLLGESEYVAGLFDAYPFDSAYSAATAIVRQLAVHGLRPEAIELEQADGLDSLLSRAVELFEHGCSACSAYQGTAKTPAQFTERCEGLLERALELREMADDDAALQILAGLVGEYRPLKLKALEEESSESQELHHALEGAVGAALVAPHARGLVELATAFGARFSEMKRAAGVLDFDDLQVLAVELLESHPDIAGRYRERFRLVMIDEFQDTDALQLRLVAALSDDDLCTVGDEKQSIYRFRGADIDVYRAHRAEMEAAGALEVPLGVNYRSHGDVLSFVNAVFSSDEYFEGDLLRLVPPDGPREPQPHDDAFEAGPRVEAMFVDSSDVDGTYCREAEAREIALRLKELTDAGVGAGDMAILVRAYSRAHYYAEALAAVGIPAVIVGGSRFFELREVATMRALTRVIANPSDGAALGELLVSEFCPITDDGLARLRLSAEGQDRAPLWELLAGRRDRLGEADAASAELLVTLVERARDALGTRPLSDVLLGAVEDSGWDLRLLSAANAGRDAFANVLKFARLAETFEDGNARGPAGFATYLDAKEALGDKEAPAAVADDQTPAVRIMSVHASKGLEFPVVVVPDLASGPSGRNTAVRTSVEDGHLRVAVSPPPTDDSSTLPKSARFAELAELDKQAEAQEGDRTLYVAFTRARDLLIVSGSYGLRPKNPPTAKHHLNRLAKLLRIAIPIDGTCDLEASLTDKDRTVPVRVRVIDAAQTLAEATSVETPAECPVPAALQACGARFESRPTASPKPSRTSYSGMHVFEQCAHRYLLEHVAGFRRAGITAAGGLEPTRFGSALHAALQLAESGELPSDERIDALCRQFELDAAGRTRLIEAAEAFLRSSVAQQAAAASRVVRELAFALPVADGTCLLAGSIDLYARDNDTALIVDYKSGESGDASDLPERYNLQATCYALAALVDGADRVRIVFTRPEVRGDDGAPQEVRFAFTRADEPALRARVDGILGEIAVSDFHWLEMRDEVVCESCAVPPGLCPNARR